MSDYDGGQALLPPGGAPGCLSSTAQGGRTCMFGLLCVGFCHRITTAAQSQVMSVKCGLYRLPTGKNSLQLQCLDLSFQVATGRGQRQQKMPANLIGWPICCALIEPGQCMQAFTSSHPLFRVPKTEGRLMKGLIEGLWVMPCPSMMSHDVSGNGKGRACMAVGHAVSVNDEWCSASAECTTLCIAWLRIKANLTKRRLRA
eukprot:scaffold31171_cov18-Tisochrysis_lutea.AAC.2